MAQNHGCPARARNTEFSESSLNDPALIITFPRPQTIIAGRFVCLGTRYILPMHNPPLAINSEQARLTPYKCLSSGSSSWLRCINELCLCPVTYLSGLPEKGRVLRHRTQ
ncbi:hypothetical protein Fot_21795 [Forsythia ovata]|uniref:Uncharacterized protein n=1 Tax=Forsythia ovata TaxID=205694 RepID=A0ABD1UVV8_9LAMI